MEIQIWEKDMYIYPYIYIYIYIYIYKCRRTLLALSLLQGTHKKASNKANQEFVSSVIKWLDAAVRSTFIVSMSSYVFPHPQRNRSNQSPQSRLHHRLSALLHSTLWAHQPLCIHMEPHHFHIVIKKCYAFGTFFLTT